MAEVIVDNVQEMQSEIKKKLLATLFFLSSSSDSDNEEFLHVCDKKPLAKVEKFIETVIHNFDGNQLRKSIY